MQKIRNYLGLYPPFIGKKVKLYYKNKNVCRFTTLDGEEKAEVIIDQSKTPIKKGTILNVPDLNETY